MSFSVHYTYQIKDLYSGALGKIRKSTERFEKTTRKVQNSLKKFSAGAVNAQSTIGSVAGVIGGAAVLGQFTNFEDKMNRLNAVTLASKEEMLSMRNVAKHLGATTEFTAGQAAEGMTFLGMAGMNTNKILKAIPGTLQLAAAGGLDLASAADIATNVLAQMGMKTNELVKVNDNLALMQARSNTNILQGAEALKNVGLTASRSGVSLSQLTALIGAMGNAGIKGGEAGTLLRNAMKNLINPSKKARQTMRKLNIDMREFVTPDGKLKNFTGLIDQLNKKGAGAIDLFNIFEDRGMRAIQALMVNGKPAIDTLTKALENSAGTAAKMAKIMMTGLPGVIKALKSAAEAVNIALFESGLSEFLIDVFNGLTKFLRGLGKANPIILKTIATLGLIAVVGGPMLLFLGLMASGLSVLLGAVSFLSLKLSILSGFLSIFSVLGFLASPIFLISVAVAAVAGSIVWLASKSGEFRQSLFNLLDAFSPIINALEQTLKLIISLFTDVGVEIGITKEGFEALSNVSTFIDGLAASIKTILSSLQLLADILETIREIGLGKTMGIAGSVISDMSGDFSDMVNQGVSSIGSLIGLGGGSSNNNIVSDFSKANNGSLNGSIDINVNGAGQLKRAEMMSSFPGNLGFNMGGGN